MLYDYLTNKYKPNEPIFLEDINLPNTTYKAVVKGKFEIFN